MGGKRTLAYAENVRFGWKADVRLIVRQTGVSEEPSSTESNGTQCQRERSRGVAFHDPHEKVSADQNGNEDSG